MLSWMWLSERVGNLVTGRFTNRFWTTVDWRVLIYTAINTLLNHQARCS